MSRHGYVDDLDNLAIGQWRGRVTSAQRGRRGQRFFRDLIAALDAMDVKELHTGLVLRAGCMCAMGAVAVYRNEDISRLAEIDWHEEDEWDAIEATEELGGILDIAPALALEIAFENDEGIPPRVDNGLGGRHGRLWPVALAIDESAADAANPYEYRKGLPVSMPLESPYGRWERMRRYAVKQLRGDL